MTARFSKKKASWLKGVRLRQYNRNFIDCNVPSTVKKKEVPKGHPKEIYIITQNDTEYPLSLSLH